MKRVSIIAATGYVGMELIRLLKKHPEVRIQHLVSSSSAGELYEKIYPQFMKAGLPELEEYDVEKLAQDTDVFFTALPHGASQQVVAQLYETGKTIIDMSGDFRYDDPLTYGAWYGKHSAPALLAKSVYGLPELYREKIKSGKLIGNPGCYPTSTVLALAPLLSEKLIDTKSILIDSKSGMTGAGKQLSTIKHFCEIDENMRAYSIATHRHTSEIEQELSNLSGNEVIINFTPHQISIKRGILSTSYATMHKYNDAFSLLRLYKEYYKGEPFVHIFDDGSLPQVKHVVGSNRIAIGIGCDSRTNRVIVVSCIDNMIKGAAGQGVQNMNIICGFPETMALDDIPIYF